MPEAAHYTCPWDVTIWHRFRVLRHEARETQRLNPRNGIAQLEYPSSPYSGANAPLPGHQQPGHGNFAAEGMEPIAVNMLHRYSSGKPSSLLVRRLR